MGVHRPGPRLQPPIQPSSARRNVVARSQSRRKVGGFNELQIIRTFEASRRRQAEELEDSNSDVSVSDDSDQLPRKAKRLKRIGYSREKKLAAIQYYKMTDIPGKKPGDPDEPISKAYACEKLGIARKSLREWLRDEVKILNTRKGAKRMRLAVSKGNHHELEYHVHKEFCSKREIGRVISGRWLMLCARRHYRRLYPHRITINEETGAFEYGHMRFSNTWFDSFKRRFGIRLRCKTKQAQKPPEDYREKIEAWLQYNRRNTAIQVGSDCGKLRPGVPVVGRFKLGRISNMDQTPIGYDFLSGRTYDHKGAKTVWVKEIRSGWDRRQATLQIAVFADGLLRCKPMLIYHGDPIGNSKRRIEEKLYDPRVVVCFNESAWATSETLQYWLKKMFAVAQDYPSSDKEPGLLSLDAFAPQMTKGMRDDLRKINVTPSYIPGGCTGFVQVLDVSLNKPMKLLISQAAQDHADRYSEEYEAGKFTVGDRRVLLTKWVGDAFDKLHQPKAKGGYKETIITTFRRVGLSLNPDGSEDSEMKIKGLPDIKVGDFTREEEDPEDGTGGLLSKDIEAIEKAKARAIRALEKRREKRVQKAANKTTKGFFIPYKSYLKKY